MPWWPQAGLYSLRSQVLPRQQPPVTAPLSFLPHLILPPSCREGRDPFVVPFHRQRNRRRKGAGTCSRHTARQQGLGLEAGMSRSDTSEPLTAISPSKCHMAQAVRPNRPGGRQGYRGWGQSTEHSRRAGPWFLGCPRLTQPRALLPAHQH